MNAKNEKKKLFNFMYNNRKRLTINYIIYIQGVPLEIFSVNISIKKPNITSKSLYGKVASMWDKVCLDVGQKWNTFSDLVKVIFG